MARKADLLDWGAEQGRSYANTYDNHEAELRASVDLFYG